MVDTNHPKGFQFEHLGSNQISQLVHFFRVDDFGTNVGYIEEVIEITIEITYILDRYTDCKLTKLHIGIDDNSSLNNIHTFLTRFSNLIDIQLSNVWIEQSIVDSMLQNPKLERLVLINVRDIFGQDDLYELSSLQFPTTVSCPNLKELHIACDFKITENIGELNPRTDHHTARLSIQPQRPTATIQK